MSLGREKAGEAESRGIKKDCTLLQITGDVVDAKERSKPRSKRSYGHISDAIGTVLRAKRRAELSDQDCSMHAILSREETWTGSRVFTEAFCHNCVLYS